MYTTPSTTVGLAWTVPIDPDGCIHCHTGWRLATFPVPIDVAAELYELWPVSNRYAGQSAVPCACAGVTASPAQAKASTDAAARSPAARARLRLRGPK